MHLKVERNKKADTYSDYSSFQQKASEFGFCWLDSSRTIGDKGLNSFLMSDPIGDLYLLNGKVQLKCSKEDIHIDRNKDIYTIVEQLVNQYDLCAVGYISYESTLEKFAIPNNSKDTIPTTRFLLYENLNEIPNDTFSTSPKNNTAIPKAQIIQSITKKEYLEKILQIKKHIKEGDIYQANFTTRFEISSPLTPFESYLRLREINQSPYAAYINFGDYQILSSSPERMFTTDGDKIKSCPIKGTITLGKNAEEQKENLQKLLHSDKDKAELLMIVDLMRNDLGKIAKTGTVSVESLFNPEVYTSLIHLVSDISATLKTNITFQDIVDAVIPGGSITGAPKKRAVEIINNLEVHPRFVYTGSIGYLTKEKSDFNIAIRTIYHRDNHYYIHAGGGIVADSDPKDEYNEMLLKAENLFQAVGL